MKNSVIIELNKGWKSMKNIDIKKWILPLLALLVFLGGTIFYCFVNTTKASILYFVLILISLGLMTIYIGLKKGKNQ